MKFTKTTLPNGVRVITAPMQGNPTVTVMINVATGAYYETPEQSGISHFLEHMCFKGTEKRPSAKVISTELDSIGASYNAFTGSEVTGYWAKADVRHFSKIADVVSDVFKHSTFPLAEIEKEKGVVIGEIDMYGDDPQEKIAETLAKHVYKGEPASRDVLGTKETVKAITHNDLISYKNSQYTPKNTVVCIAGGIDEKDMMSWAKETFGLVPDTESRPLLPTNDRVQVGPELVHIEKDTDQSHIVMLWRTFDRKHPDRYVAAMIRNLLRSGMSSRLFIKLREELGSGYYVSAHHGTSKTFGRFSISTGTAHARVPEIIDAIIKETARLKTELVPADELAKVKEYRRAHLLMGLETSDDVADFLIDQEIFKNEIHTPEKFEEIFSKITAEDIKRVANIVFDPKKLTVGVIGKGIDVAALKNVIGA